MKRPKSRETQRPGRPSRKAKTLGGAVVEQQGREASKARAHRAATFGLREAKARLSELVRLARTGQIVTITDHGEPVARLVAPSELSLEERLDAMERRGELEPARGPWPVDLAVPIFPAEAADLLQRYLRDDRDSD
ncbi:MAG: type II toxin-antitoxin system prevent-host-death family antitoxin [Thermoanaerobaculia bacterium]|nr:MAG: type II toxin-antitoxin system prevent-host-death family antitoxin [Thermoanaerobaculia bacterium]MBZ0103423.1 type II toxin-antitoxin system prevent-host-death family antitoxin [Thermoanaerobaculia bacterium]